MIGTEPRSLLIFSGNTRCDDLRNALARIFVVGFIAKTCIFFVYGMLIYPARFLQVLTGTSDRKFVNTLGKNALNQSSCQV